MDALWTGGFHLIITVFAFTTALKLDGQEREEEAVSEQRKPRARFLLWPCFHPSG